MTSSNEIYALKRVTVDKADSESMRGYVNEIELLNRLAGNDRIIKLIDSETRNNPSGGGSLSMLMECGEIGQRPLALSDVDFLRALIDLSKLIQEQQSRPLNMVWIAYYWQQVRALECFSTQFLTIVIDSASGTDYP